MPKFKKGSPEAKAFMAKLRRMKKKSATPKKKSAPKKKAVKKSAPKRTSTHKDTRSHNVNIKVVSGIGFIQSDLKRKLTASQKHLSELVGQLAQAVEFGKLTRNKTYKAQAVTLRKKIAEARKLVARLKKVAK